jgi:hypothetical protein
VVLDPEIATTTAGINNAKKLTPTVSSARTVHLSRKLLLVTPMPCHAGPKFAKQTHPDLQ